MNTCVTFSAPRLAGAPGAVLCRIGPGSGRTLREKLQPGWHLRIGEASLLTVGVLGIRTARRRVGQGRRRCR